LTLARHRLCAKSLYCGWQGGTRLFGSEPPALRAHPAFQAPAHRGALALLRRALTRPRAGLAAYSNRAGSHAERFIVADGRSFQGADGSFVEGASFVGPAKFIWPSR
jgi:asparagine synthase (glutamine-hydrolysing)